jgi:amidase
VFEEYDQFDGLGLAALVRRREVSARELCDEAIRRISALNPSLNAVVHRTYDAARRQAGGSLPAGPFAGVPFLLKDLAHAQAGVPMSFGSRALHDYVPSDDAEVVRRYRASGVLLLGKTNTPEFGLMGTTEPELFGPTHNPWDRSRTPGGSSGGSAAAVAARMVPLASAADGGGSIRIPAACCGVFGLKPSRGRVPVGPYAGELWEGAVCDGVLSISVRDSAAMLDAIAGPYAGAPYGIEAPERPFLQETEREPRALRVGFCTRSPIGTPVDPECVRAVEHAVRLLGELGHEAEEAEPDVDGWAAARSYMMLYFGQVAADVAWLRDERGAAAVRLLEPGTRALATIGEGVSSRRYIQSVRRWNDFARAMARYHERFDLYLTPTLATPPALLGTLKPRGAEKLGIRVVNAMRAGRLLLASGIVDRLVEQNLSRTPFTQLANFTGQPAMSVPLHWTPDGLPCGVQFVAPHGDEATLFRLAAQLERARPWRGRRPPLPPASRPRPAVGVCA